MERKLELLKCFQEKGKSNEFVFEHFSFHLNSVAARLAAPQGINYAEFSYSLFQAYDYYLLHERYGINLQASGPFPRIDSLSLFLSFYPCLYSHMIDGWSGSMGQYDCWFRSRT